MQGRILRMSGLTPVCIYVSKYSAWVAAWEKKGKGAWKSDLQPYNKGKSKGKEKSDQKQRQREDL